MTCPRCSGYDPECPEPDEDDPRFERGLAGCGGSGRVAVYRCPQAIIDGRTARMLTFYQHYHAHGVLPRAGGLEDQSPRFLASVRLVDSERVAIRDEFPRVRDEEASEVAAASREVSREWESSIEERRAAAAAAFHEKEAARGDT